MTVQSTYRRAGPFNGNGIATQFPFEFKVFQKTDLHVVCANELGVETDLVLDSDFSVALNLDQDADPGGTVTYPSAGSGGNVLPTGWRLVVLSNLPQSQLTDITNVGRFNPDVMERAFDKNVVLVQQLAEQVSRAVLVPVSSDTSPGSLIKELVDAAAVAIKAAADAAAAVIDATLLRVDLASTDAGKGPALVSFKAALTDSVGRLLLDKLTDMAGAKDFGANGNGVALNNTAITRAVAALKLATVPSGTYKMSSGTFGKAGSVIRMEPGAKFSSGAGALSFADNSTFEGFNEGADGLTHYKGRRFSGTRATGVGPVNGGFSPVAWMYDVRSDSSDCGETFGVGLTSRLIFGGNQAKGGRIAFNGTVEQQDGATNPLSLNRNYVGTQGTAYAQGYGTLGGDGGTAGNEKGGYFGLAGAAYVNSLARYVFDATGAEFNTFIGTGTVGLKYTSGISVVGVNAERGTVIDCGIRIGGQSQLDGVYTGHKGWTAGITFTDTNGAAPLFEGGSVMNTVWAGGGKRTIGRGLDFAGFDITAEVIRSGDYMKLLNDHLYLADLNGFSTIEPNGPSVNASLMLRGRGSGLVGIGPWTNMGSDAPANGFIRVLDSTGAERKLLTTP